MTADPPPSLARLVNIARLGAGREAAVPDHGRRPAAEPPPPAAPPITPRRPIPRAPAAPAASDGDGLDAPRLQRRLVTVLLAGVAPTHDPTSPQGDPEVVRDRAERRAAEHAERISRYGGTARATATGHMLATFGADRARDDDPERAVRAALELIGAAEEHDRPQPAVRCGVATGEAVVTATTDGSEQVAGVVAEEALALALTAAPGTVLVSAATYQATSRRIDYQPAPAGSARWRALAPRARTAAADPDPTAVALVGRHGELTYLEDLLGRWRRDRDLMLVTLIGDPGMGKSRLVAELGRLVDEAPDLIGWRVGHIRPYGQHPLGALADIVRAEVGIRDSDPTPTIREKLRAAASDLGGDPGIGGSLAQLLGVANPGQAPPSREVRFDDCAEFLAMIAERRPLVLILEDLHWADAPLLDFLDTLVGRARGTALLVVGTARPEFLKTRPSWGGGRANTTTLTLPPLPRTETASLLDAVVAKRQLTLPPGTRDALVDAAGGNPLYVEEYAHLLAGHDTQDPAGGPLPMPTSVAQVIAARLDTLPPAAKQLLQDAAVIGESVWAGALAAVSGHDRQRVAEGVRRLEWRGLLRRVRVSSVAGETEYAFRHTLLREVAYGQLLRADRADKHQRAAAWLRQLTPDHDTLHIEALAHHYSQALELTRATGQPADALLDRARTTAALAGDHAARLGGYPAAAARHYQTAASLWPTSDPAYPGLLLRLGQALVLGAHTGHTQLQQARDAALAAGQADVAAEADALLGLLAITRGQWETADRHAQRGLDALPGRQDPAAAALSALATRAVCLTLADRHDDALAAAGQLVTLARRHGSADHEGQGLHLAGVTKILAGDLDGGQADCSAGMARLEDQRSPHQVFAYLGWARALLFYGDLAACADMVHAGRQAAETAGGAYRHYLDSVQVGVDYAAGRWKQTLAVADRVLAQPDERSNPRVQATCLLFRGRVLLARGQLDDALADADHALEVIHPDDLRYHQVLLALHGRILLAAGDHQRATACLEDLLASQRKRPPESCATPDQAALMIDLAYPADALPEALAATRWHAAVRAHVTGDVAHAAELYTAIGSVVDADADAARSQPSPAEATR